MDYQATDVPVIHDYCSYQNDLTRDRVICHAAGRLKILNCEPEVLEEVLGHVNGVRTFAEIESVFTKKYPEETVKYFLRTILQEGILKKQVQKATIFKTPELLIIGEGAFAEALSQYPRLTISEFLEMEECVSFDIAIFTPQVCTYGELLAVNKKLYDQNKHFLQLVYTGDCVAVGPLIIPKATACLQCVVAAKVEKINAKLSADSKLELSDIYNLNYASPLPVDKPLSLVGYITNVLLEDITDFFNGQDSDFLDYKHEIRGEFTTNTDVTKVSLYQIPSSVYFLHNSIRKEIFGETGRVTTLQKPIFEATTTADLLCRLAVQVKEKVKGDVYYVDLSRPGMNTKVVRVLVTGDIQYMHAPLTYVSERAFEFGLRCGYSNKKTTYETIYLGNEQG